jgi:hypothetical protein
MTDDTETTETAETADNEATLTASDSTIPFVGEWRRLMSTTNWDKGRIIFEWREAMQDSDADPAEYTDEEWSNIVGGVTPQHVGRLRRVFGRFHEVHDAYKGLYWSHFCAAVDWEDAEMWLEGAIQNSWSVTKMRKQRWETLGSPADEEPHDEDIIVAEPEVEQQLDDHDDGPDAQIIDDSKLAQVEAASDSDDDSESENDPSMAAYASEDAPETLVRPFANLAELPEDMATAFEDFKLSILQHKMNGWKEIAQEDVLASLDSLRALALSPSGA